MKICFMKSRIENMPIMQSRQDNWFRVYNLHSIKDMEEDPKEDWVQVPLSKKKRWGVFEV